MLERRELCLPNVIKQFLDVVPNNCATSAINPKIMIEPAITAFLSRVFDLILRKISLYKNLKARSAQKQNIIAWVFARKISAEEYIKGCFSVLLCKIARIKTRGAIKE